MGVHEGGSPQTGSFRMLSQGGSPSGVNWVLKDYDTSEVMTLESGSAFTKDAGVRAQWAQPAQR